ncbi:MAG: gliding motility-associated-like protein [Cyclobacteriaceae bacterium]|jgi:gliding motility-associated-like protein
MILRIYISITLITIYAIASAQILSPLGRFSIDYNKGCNPTTVHITQLDTFGNISRLYSYEDGIEESLDTFYTYNSPGIYKIVQFVGEDVKPKSDTILFTLIDSRQPQFDIFLCENSSFNISITDDNYDLYQYSSLDSFFITKQKSFNIVRGNSNDVNIRGLFNDSFNKDCGSLTKSVPFFQPLSTPKIDSIYLQEACKGFYQLSVTGLFNHSVKYELSYSLDNANSFVNFYEGSLKDSISIIISLQDLDFSKYCVQIKSINACDNLTVNSSQFCNVPVRHYDDLKNVYATYIGDNIRIMLPETSWNHVISRSANNDAFIILDTTQNSFLDENIFGNRFYQYKVDKIDSCSQVIWSTVVTPPYQAIVSKDRENNILRTNQIRPMLSASITDSLIILYNQDSTSSITASFATDIKLFPELGNVQSIRSSYTIESGVKIFSNELKSTYKFIIHTPNAFTPNNDGLNDLYEFFGLPNIDGQLFIFDRWGKNIYHSTQPWLGWDGYIKDEIAPAGTYSYKIQFNIEGEIQKQVGSFVLIKN